MRAKIQHGAAELSLNLNEQQVSQLDELLSQLMKWNASYNLTAIKDIDQAFKLHLLDSLAIVPFWRFRKTLDVGTGPGFPGLPLAIALPEQQFHLLDSNSKKIRFIRQQIHQLGLTNVSVYHSRIEDHRMADYDAIVSRAFATLTDMVKLSQHCLQAGGRWMAMKGIYAAQEVADLPTEIVEVNNQQLKVPGLQAERCLIELKRVND